MIRIKSLSDPSSFSLAEVLGHVVHLEVLRLNVSVSLEVLNQVVFMTSG